MTGVPPGAAPIERFLHEEPITVEQIGIREECIAALGGGACANPSG